MQMCISAYGYCKCSISHKLKQFIRLLASSSTKQQWIMDSTFSCTSNTSTNNVWSWNNDTIKEVNTPSKKLQQLRLLLTVVIPRTWAAQHCFRKPIPCTHCPQFPLHSRCLSSWMSTWRLHSAISYHRLVCPTFHSFSMHRSEILMSWGWPWRLPGQTITLPNIKLMNDCGEGWPWGLPKATSVTPDRAPLNQVERRPWCRL